MTGLAENGASGRCSIKICHLVSPDPQDHPYIRLLGLIILSGEVSLEHVPPVVHRRFHEDIFLLLNFMRHWLADQ